MSYLPELFEAKDYATAIKARHIFTVSRMLFKVQSIFSGEQGTKLHSKVTCRSWTIWLRVLKVLHWPQSCAIEGYATRKWIYIERL